MYLTPGKTIFPQRFEDVLQQTNLGTVILNPEVTTSNITSESYDARGELGYAIFKTFRAITIGIGIAALDGPLPFADVVGLAYASWRAYEAWDEYFEASS